MNDHPLDEDKRDDPVDDEPSSETPQTTPEASGKSLLGSSYGHPQPEENAVTQDESTPHSNAGPTPDSTEKLTPSWASSFLDDAPADTPTGSPLREPSASDERRLAADHLFVDVLLQEVYRLEKLSPESPLRHDARCEQSLQTVFAAIRRKETAPQPAPALPSAEEGSSPLRHKRRWPILGMLSSLSVAAALIVGIFLFGNPTDQAVAALASIRTAAARPDDLEYTVHTELGSLLDTTIDSTLFVRGDEKFALRQQAPLGIAWAGSDGKRFWLVPGAPVGPILESDNPEELQQWLTETHIEAPYLQVTAVLEGLGRFYDIRIISTDETDAASDQIMHLSGTRRPQQDSLLPETIDVWANAKTGMVDRLLLDWHRPKKDRGVRRMEFILKAPVTLPDDFYNPTKHIAPERRVVPL